jgi:hypothetical protein
MKQSNSFQDFDQFTSFDNEQFLMRLAARRHQRGISCKLPETHDWVFGPELDNELDEIKRQFIQSSLGVISCH